MFGDNRGYLSSSSSSLQLSSLSSYFTSFFFLFFGKSSSASSVIMSSRIASSCTLKIEHIERNSRAKKDRVNYLGKHGSRKKERNISVKVGGEEGRE